MSILKIVTILVLLMNTLFAKATISFSPSDSTHQDTTILRDFEIKASRQATSVVLHIYVKHPETITSISVERSADYSDAYTSIMTIAKERIKEIKNNQLNLMDKFPLPQTKNVYYRVVVEDIEGVIRMFPPTEMPKLNSTAINK